MAALMTQTAIPFLFMRGGTSRGPYLNRADLPEDLDTLAEVLIAMVGSGHPLNIDGIGGGAAVTTKVAMLSKSELPDCDIDYFFGQVSVEDRLVDFKPTCGPDCPDRRRDAGEHLRGEYWRQSRGDCANPKRHRRL